MTDLKNKVAVVTGASSGIGAAIVTVLLEEGMKVVGLARRVEKVEALRKNHKDSLFVVKTDITKEEDIQNAISWTQTNVGPVHVFINNAGVAGGGPIDTAKPEDIANVLNTNLLAVILSTQAAIKNMKSNNIDGTIINIASVYGHYIAPFPGISVYTSSKFGLRAFSESIRGELARTGSKIRITNMSPGLVSSEMSNKAPGLLENNPHLLSEDVANAVKFVLALPHSVNISELIIRPTGEKLI